MKYLLPLLLLSLLALPSCTDEEPVVPACTGVRIGATFTTPDRSERLTVTNIMESRCPCDALCVWPGTVQVALRSGKGDSLTVVLNDRRPPPDNLIFDGKVLRLREVTHREVCDAFTLAEEEYCLMFDFE